MKRDDMIGRRFGKWTVLEFIGTNEYRMKKYLCQCECGTVKVVLRNSLTSGRSKSCGCRYKEIYTGLSRTRLHNIWYNMLVRCYNEINPKFKDYGARGIRVCQEWKDDFLAFWKWALENGYDDGLTIDRIDVNGNYEPSNCRWVTQHVQQNNRSNNRLVTYNGAVMTLENVARLNNVSAKKLRYRLEKGLDIYEAIASVKGGHRFD